MTAKSSNDDDDDDDDVPSLFNKWMNCWVVHSYSAEAVEC